MLTHLNPSPLPPSRVVVLGARGFVAAATISRLQRTGIPVVGFASSSLDLTDPASTDALVEQLDERDAVVFVAGLTPDRGKDIETFMRNLRMGQHVCAALARRPVAHVIHVGSDAVYADSANPVRETSCAQPGAGFHGTMHAARERMLIETLRPTGTPLALLRPTLIFGPGDTHNGYGPNRFVRTAKADRVIALFGGGEEKRDHVFIDDVAALIEAVLLHRSSGVLNIASGTATSFRDVAEAVRGLVGQDVDIRTSARANPVTHRHFDVSALLSAFPAFRVTSLRDGLERMLADEAPGAR